VSRSPLYDRLAASVALEREVLGTHEGQEDEEFYGAEGGEGMGDGPWTSGAIASNRVATARSVEHCARSGDLVGLASRFAGFSVVSVSQDRQSRPQVVSYVPHRSDRGFFVVTGQDAHGGGHVRSYGHQDSWYHRLSARSGRVGMGYRWVWTADPDFQPAMPGGPAPREVARLLAMRERVAGLSVSEFDLLDEASLRMAPVVYASGDFALALTYGALKAIIRSLRNKSQQASDVGEPDSYDFPGQEGRQF